MDKDCKYREYDEIVAKTLHYVLNLKDEDFKIDYFDEDDIIDLELCQWHKCIEIGLYY